jgi:hypothetical protein
MAALIDYFEDHPDIIHMVLDGEWTMQEWLLGSYQATSLIQQSETPVRLLVEYRSHPMYHPPALFANLNYIGYSPLIRERRIQRVIVVGENGILHTASEVFRRVYRLKRVVVASDIEQARSFLELAMAH